MENFRAFKCNKDSCTKLPLGFKRVKITQRDVPYFQFLKILINVDIDITNAIQNDILKLGIVRVHLRHIESMKSIFQHSNIAM